MSNLTIERSGGRIALEGELDLASVAELEAAVDGARAEGNETVVLDLSELEFMDSSGLRSVVQIDKRAKDEGWSFSLVRGPDAVHRVFELTRMDRRLTFTEA